MSSLLTLLIAIAVAYVAWQQWRLAEQRFKLDLYDRRIGLYAAAMELTSTILITAAVTDEALHSFLQKTREAPFFYNDEISEYFKELYKRAVELHGVNLALRDPPTGPDRTAKAEMKSNLILWFNEQIDTMVGRFKPFLRVESPSGMISRIVRAKVERYRRRAAT